MPEAALITGGTGSVGRALVKQFVQAGWTVDFTYRSKDQSAEALLACGARSALKIDFAAGELPPPADYGALVLNAGVNISSDLTVMVSREDWDRTLQINLTAPFLIVQRFLPPMLRRRRGRIVMVGSIYSLRGSRTNAPYNVSKHGLSGLMKSVAKEYARDGITCNEVCPGAIYSDMLTGILEKSAAAAGVPVEALIRDLEAAQPPGRLAWPEEVAFAVLYLCSDRAAHISGASIPVDGGMIS